MVSVKFTLSAFNAPVLVMVTVYIMVSPGLTVAVWARLSVLVAVNVVANGLAAPTGSSFNGVFLPLCPAPIMESRESAASLPCGRVGSTRVFSLAFKGERSLDPDAGLSADPRKTTKARAHTPDVMRLRSAKVRNDRMTLPRYGTLLVGANLVQKGRLPAATLSNRSAV